MKTGDLQISSLTKPFVLLFMSTVILGLFQRSCRSAALAFQTRHTTTRPTTCIRTRTAGRTRLTCSMTTSTSSSSAAFTSTSSSDQNQDDHEDLRFGRFKIASNQIFYQTSLSAAFVNLRPIVPGHVLVMPRRRHNNDDDNNIPVLLSDLTEEEYHDLWQSVRVVQGVLKRHYANCSAFNVAVQDGDAAGQSVPHVHVHVLPRSAGDYERNDDVYQDMEDWAPRQEMQEAKKKAQQELQVLEDENRRDRTTEQMAAEAEVYRNILEEQSEEQGNKT